MISPETPRLRASAVLEKDALTKLNFWVDQAIDASEGLYELDNNKPQGLRRLLSNLNRWSQIKNMQECAQQAGEASYRLELIRNMGGLSLEIARGKRIAKPGKITSTLVGRLEGVPISISAIESKSELSGHIGGKDIVSCQKYAGRLYNTFSPLVEERDIMETIVRKRL